IEVIRRFHKGDYLDVKVHAAGLAVSLKSAVINAEYRISGTHVNPLGLTSDALMDVIWDIMQYVGSKHVYLLGADAVNNLLNNNDEQEAEEPQTKRIKTEE
ncbi:probable tRNA (guanine(26)-N(2))-dimethyltransferase 2, partial [Tanacetum coccineum]